MLSESGEVVLNPGLNSAVVVDPGVVSTGSGFLSPPQPPIANTVAAIQSAVEKFFAVMTVSPSNLPKYTERLPRMLPGCNPKLGPAATRRRGYSPGHPMGDGGYTGYV